MPRIIVLLLFAMIFNVNASQNVERWSYDTAMAGMTLDNKSGDSISVLFQPLTFCYSTPALFPSAVYDDYHGQMYIDSQALNVKVDTISLPNGTKSIYVCTNSQDAAEYAIDKLWGNSMITIRWAGIGGNFTSNGFKESLIALTNELKKIKPNNKPAL
ncbi:TPA: hypothetical protein ACPZNJ_000398 [Yersinia enterocolitica]|uniref:hypothetical protein n=1 Tax=Yersinia sp. J1 TaxID=3424774 RepID=UPI00330C7E13|nr:hypothetical protein [Yersinia enterocolitica]